TLSRTRAHGRAHHRRGAIHLLGGLAHLRHNTTGGRLFPACPVGALRVGSRRGADGVKGLPGRHERPHPALAGALGSRARSGAARHRLVLPPPPIPTTPAGGAGTDVISREKNLSAIQTKICALPQAAIPTSVFYYRANRVAKPPLLRPDTVSRLLAAL